jgi:hypothetical protein
MSTIRLKEANLINRLYEEAIRLMSMPKYVKAGGALLTFPDKEQRFAELSATFIVKKGRFAKEQRVVVVLPFKRDEDGGYIADVEESVFHVVEDDKGNLKEVWSGRLKEAKSRLEDITNIYINIISEISKKAS